MGELLVRGVAEDAIPPDTATVTVTVVGRHPGAQAEALGRAAVLAAAVDGELEDRRQGESALVRRLAVSSIRVHEEYDHTGGRRTRTGYAAARTSEVECRADGSALTDLIAALGRDGVRISGPRWHVDPASDGWLPLRIAAVADARRRAEAYATALGAELGPVRWLAEPGLRQGLGGHLEGTSGTPRFARAMAAAEAEEPVTLRVTAESVPVSVTVEVAFDLA
jgi:hypothetical protein